MRNYPWSSYAAYAGYRKTPEWLETGDLLGLARRFCGLTLREVGEQMEGMDYAAVSVMLKRFDLRVEKERELRTALNRAIDMLNVETRHQ